MYSICAVLGMLAVVAALPAEQQDTALRFESLLGEFESTWSSFKDTHSKTYDDTHEEGQRKEIFKNNLKAIEMHNYLHEKGLKTFRLGVNQYADMELGEFTKQMNGFKPTDTPRSHWQPATFMKSLSPVNVPDSMDWRDHGYVTPVKNQGACGSCWSFSTTGALEGQHFRKTGDLVSLSEQNLMDCSVPWGNNGCNGGLMDYAFQYIKDNQGVDTETSYPYLAQDGTCHYNKRDIGADDVGYTDCTSGDEDGLKEASATIGPISVAIDASHQSFQLYQSGVYTDDMCSSTQLDHGVLLVGYGTEAGQDYWLVKNSWGPTWGDEGYIKIARNMDNLCGVATQASYPIV